MGRAGGGSRPQGSLWVIPRPGSGLLSRDLEKAGKPDKCLAGDYIRALGRPEVFQGVWSHLVWTTGAPRASHSEDSHRFLGPGHSRESEPGEGPWLLQGKGSLLVRGIRGDYFNVMGFPVAEVWRALTDLGVLPAKNS